MVTATEQRDRQEGETTILVVDDDPSILALLRTYLQAAGYRTLLAETGQEAIRLTLEMTPDLVLLDMGLPDQQGIDVARLIRRDSDVPVMFLSACSDENIVRQAVDEGAMGYLVKPLNTMQIVPSVHAALMRADELKQLRTAESNLAAALAIGRETSVAIGILMERHGLSQEVAFDILRAQARARRSKVADLAREIVGAAETLNAFSAGERHKRTQ